MRGGGDGLRDVHPGLVGEQVDAVSEFAEASRPVRTGTKRCAAALGLGGNRRGQRTEQRLQFEQQCRYGSMQLGCVRTLCNDLT